MGDSFFAKRVYWSSPILFSYSVTLVDLIERNMLNFDVILAIGWLHACLASIYCKTMVIKFQFPNELILEWKGETQSLDVKFITCLKPVK